LPSQKKKTVDRQIGGFSERLEPQCAGEEASFFV